MNYIIKYYQKFIKQLEKAKTTQDKQNILNRLYWQGYKDGSNE